MINPYRIRNPRGGDGIIAREKSAIEYYPVKRARSVYAQCNSSIFFFFVFLSNALVFQFSEKQIFIFFFFF